MRRLLISAVVVFGLAAMAMAGYSNDFSTLADLSSRAPVGAPYLDDVELPSAVCFDVPAGSSSYMIADLFYDGAPGPINGQGGDITLTWKMDFTGATPPSPSPVITLWLRVYTGTQSDGTWTMVNRASYAFEAVMDAGWDTETKAVSAYNELYYPEAPFDASQIYKFRFDIVFWDAAYSPNTFCFDQLTVTPEPASLAVLALGGLALLRRRRS